jgi:NadR type nicotinamide-nucleotide adenylyltransferase
MIRIAFTGPESSGKTTISKLIAQQFDATWIEEYAREYLHQSNGLYNAEDLDKIAVGQADKWKGHDCELLICDTEVTVLKIWSEVKYEHVSSCILKCYDEQQFDYYFLCRPDIPWEEDALRENPHDRHELFERYKKELEMRNRNFSILEGSVKSRVDFCSQKINQLVNASI